MYFSPYIQLGIGIAGALVILPVLLLLVARALRIEFITKFFIFFDPWFSIVKFKIGAVTYGLGWLPIGCYVKYIAPPTSSIATLKLFHASFLILHIIIVLASISWIGDNFNHSVSYVINIVIELFNLMTFRNDSMNSIQVIKSNMNKMTNVVALGTTLTTLCFLWTLLWETFSKGFSKKVSNYMMLLIFVSWFFVTIRVCLYVSLHFILDVLKGYIYTSSVLFFLSLSFFSLIKYTDKKNH
jgi:hypothetical protein